VTAQPSAPPAAADAIATASDRLPVAETFASIQGEGGLTGVPSFFIRLSGCNLRCAWCDTPYASWRPEGDARAIADLVREARESALRHVVVTGGEPMIFPQVAPLTHALRDAGLHITIETAGTIVQPVACDLMSISPKLANSTPHGPEAARHEARRINIPVLQSLLDSHPERQIKFVFTGPGDLPEVESILARLRGWRADDIMLMPEGVAAPDPDLRQATIDACMRHGWRYCHRLHIELFGNRRGT
jgi:7-carboxy-7-deazaguanine synthase